MGLVTCPECYPEAFPREFIKALPRQNEGHCSARFGDHTGALTPGTFNVERLTIDGEEFPLVEAIECMAGENGWIVGEDRLLGSPTRCPNCRLVLMRHVMRGRVTVEATIPT